MILQYGGLVMTVEHALFPSGGYIPTPGVVLHHKMEDGFMVTLAFDEAWFDAHVTEACQMVCESAEGWKVKKECHE
jgi:hypothetical protein